MKEAVRIGIFGASGSGKSWKAKQIIKNCRRLIVFDPMNEYAAGRGWHIVSSVAGLKKVLIKNWKEGFKVAYVISGERFNEAEKELSDLSNFLYYLQADFDKSRLGLTFVVDELSLSYPKNGKCGTGFTNLACRGRHRGINLIGISQRVAQVNTNFRGNCSSFYIYRPADHIDIETAGRIIGRNYIGQLSTMRNYQYFCVKYGKIFFKK